MSAYKESTLNNNANNNYTYMLPYEVIEDKPEKSMVILDNQPVIIVVNKDVSKETLVNELIGKQKMDYEKDPRTAKQVLAVDYNSKEIGMAIWAGGDKTIKVYIFPQITRIL